MSLVERDPGRAALHAMHLTLDEEVGDDSLDPIGSGVRQLRSLLSVLTEAHVGGVRPDPDMTSVLTMIDRKIGHIAQAHAIMTGAYRARISALEEELAGYAVDDNVPNGAARALRTVR